MGLLRLVLLLGSAFAAAGEGQPLAVTNAPSDLAFVNGEFEASSVQHHGRPCYKKVNATDVWLCRAGDGSWNFQPESELGEATGWIVSDVKGAPSPATVSGWKAWRGARWEPAAEFRVEGGGSVGDYLEDEELKWTVAVMLLGSLACLRIMLALINSEEARIRSYAYKTISSTISTFMGVLANSAVRGLILDAVIPVVACGSLSAAMAADAPEPSTEVTILFGFAMFTAVFVLVIFLGWKFQYSQTRLWALKKFVSSICAWGAVFAFQEILEVVVFKLDPEWRIPGAAFTAVSAFALFVIYETASEALVSDFFSKPPTDPWPPPRRPLLLAGAAQQVRSTCLCLWQSVEKEVAPPAAAPPERVRPHWYEEVRESEDDVMVYTVSFLINETIAYSSTHQFHGALSAYNPIYQWEVYYWLGSLGVLWALSGGVFLLRAYLSDKSWFGSSIQRILLSSMGFCLYRMCTWQMSLTFGEDCPTLPVLSAAAFSALSFAWVIILDRIANLAHRMAPECSAIMHGRFAGTSTMTAFEWGMHTEIKMVGMLVGLSWGNAFRLGFADIVDSEPVLAAHKVLSRIVLSIALILLMLQPWRRSILPMAEKSESMHEEDIQHERAHLAGGESFLL